MRITSIISRKNIKFISRILILMALFSTSVVEAGRYRQPSYVTNAYFTNNLITGENRPEPDHIINVVRAGYEDTRGYMVLDLITDKGTHNISLELLDSEGNKLQTHEFPPAFANKDDFIVSLNLHYGGDLPAGGIFFRLYDKFENKDKIILGTFRILTDRW